MIFFLALEAVAYVNSPKVICKRLPELSESVGVAVVSGFF